MRPRLTKILEQKFVKPKFFLKFGRAYKIFVAWCDRPLTETKQGFDYKIKLANSLKYMFSREKIKTPALDKKPFFHYKLISEHMKIYIRFERLLNDLFRAIFAFAINRIIRFLSEPETTVCKECLQQIWLQSDISLSR